MVTRKGYDPDIDDEDEEGGSSSSGGKKVVQLKNRNLIIKKESDEEDDSDSGAAELDVEELNAYRQAYLKKHIREGEKKFGIVPDTEDPNSLLGKPRKTASYGERPSMHPLLEKSQEFSGVPPKDNPVPHDNPEANEKFQEARLENQLRAQLTNSKKIRNVISPPTLTR